MRHRLSVVLGTAGLTMVAGVFFGIVAATGEGPLKLDCGESEFQSTSSVLLPSGATGSATPEEAAEAFADIPALRASGAQVSVHDTHLEGILQVAIRRDGRVVQVINVRRSNGGWLANGDASC